MRLSQINATALILNIAAVKHLKLARPDFKLCGLKSRRQPVVLSVLVLILGALELHIAGEATPRL